MSNHASKATIRFLNVIVSLIALLFGGLLVFAIGWFVDRYPYIALVLGLALFVFGMLLAFQGHTKPSKVKGKAEDRLKVSEPVKPLVEPVTTLWIGWQDGQQPKADSDSVNPEH